jgi:hypothetical protein
MEILGIPLALCLGGIGLLLALGAGIVVLVKLGVIAKYALKDEPPEGGEYGLDQSREAKE